MKLSIGDRLALLSVMPSEGSITTLRIVRELKDNLSFSEVEHSELELENAEGGVRWNRDATDPMKDVPIGEKATDTIMEALERMNSRGNLMEAHMGIWDIFME